MESEKKKKWRRGGRGEERRGGEGAGWRRERERERSKRTKMKRIKMEEKTIAMEGRRGKRRGEDGEREEGKKMEEGSKGFTGGGRECLFLWSQTAQMAS